MYKKTTITQLGTCIVELKHKNNTKKCKFFGGSREQGGFVRHA